MKIKLILSAVYFLISSESMFSQGSLNISISPGGLSNKEIYNQDNDNDFKYDFKNVVGAQIAYEYMKNGKCFLAELSYYNGKFDRAELKGTSSTFNPENFKDYKSYDATLYYGLTINPKKRIQFPFYIGLGGGYSEGGPQKGLFIHAAAKARIKFFLTNRIGLFVGVTGKYGYSTLENKSNKDIKYDVFNWRINADTGAIFYF